MYISRHLEKEVLKASRSYPVVMVCGQRQVGKSTMLYHLKEESRRYVSMDDRNARRLAEQDPLLFFEAYPPPLIIDEFQKAPDLLLDIKRMVDEKILRGEKAAGLFWLTCSQKFQMMKHISESLAGRVAVLEMTGLSAREIEGREDGVFQPIPEKLKSRLSRMKQKSIHEVFADIFRGSMPKVVSGEAERESYYRDYVATYLERDIRELSQVGKLSEFYDFLVLMAARTGQELKYTDIAAAIGVSSPTVKNWVSLLEQSGVIFILRPYFSNISRRLVKTPKLYFLDTGLAAYLSRWPSSETLENGAMDGAFFETYVVSEIIKSYYNEGKEPPLYYYRDIDKKEVDLLLAEGNSLFPMEIKKGKAPEKADRAFSVLDKLDRRVENGLVICNSDELVPYSRRAWYCPVELI